MSLLVNGLVNADTLPGVSRLHLHEWAYLLPFIADRDLDSLVAWPCIDTDRHRDPLCNMAIACLAMAMYYIC